MAQAPRIRQETKATFHLIESGNSSSNAKKMQEFIREKELRRNQIISLTSNESDVEEGNHVLTLFYREEPIFVSSPLDNIQFMPFDSFQTWDQQLDAASRAFKVDGRSLNVIGLSRTPKNIGNARLQTMWYTNEQGHPDTASRLITRGDGDWEALSHNVLSFLNEFVAPHLLVSVTFHEEMHPNSSKNVFAVVTHNAGKTPVKLAETAAAQSATHGALYNLNVVRGNTTQEAVQRAKEEINVKGGQEGWVVTTTNDLQNGDIFCVLYSWNSLVEAQVEEELRPASCGCNIF